MSAEVRVVDPQDEPTLHAWWQTCHRAGRAAHRLLHPWEEEGRRDEIGRDTFVADALTPDDSLVGCTDLFVDRAHPVPAKIGVILVVPEHRGHAQSLAMKLATRRALHAAYPECAMVQTSNSGTNAPMNAVNDRLGYRVVEETQELQKKL